MKLIGIDPGITATGYSLIDESNCIMSGTIRPKQRDTFGRIQEICARVSAMISEHTPDCVVLEKVFHHKNVQSLIRSSELRGAIIMAVLSTGTKIVEYTPAQIKLTTTGNGRASKQQVRYFIERAIMKDPARRSSHAIDAIAIAYTGMRKIGRGLSRRMVKANQ